MFLKAKGYAAIMWKTLFLDARWLVARFLSPYLYCLQINIDFSSDGSRIYETHGNHGGPCRGRRLEVEYRAMAVDGDPS